MASPTAADGGDPDLATLARAARWLAAGHRVALATVVETWGSAPRGVGSHLAVRADGLFAGSISGGCVEGDVVAAASALLAKDTSVRELTFGVANETAWRAGLACGGRIRILIENLSRNQAFLAPTLAAARARIGAWRLIALDDGADCWGAGNAAVQGPLVEDAAAAGLALPPQTASGSRLMTLTERSVFLRVYEPARRLVITGAVHIAAYLARFAGALGYGVMVIDPRGAFLDAFRTQMPDDPAVIVIEDWPDEVFLRQPLDAWSALVTLTHDPKIDDAALQAALASPAFYIGALGSRRTQAARLARLAKRGWSERDLARIHGPVGLAIGAKGPAEIAVSILAEIVAAARTPIDRAGENAG